MLTRVYGTAWPTEKELKAYLRRLEEARARDHRKIGKDLELFTFSPDTGAGIPLFLPKGEMMRHLMEDYVREVQTRHGYEHVWTGHLVNEALFAKSGHLEHYRESMFPPMIDGETRYRLKPMNCPSHMTLYNSQAHSYRDLPLRYAEFATLYRYEKSGELTGLTRVRSLTQDDAHVFCTEDQIQEEFARALEIVREVLDTYGFADYRVQLSLRDQDVAKYVADDAKWSRAEKELREALDTAAIAYDEEAGEAAFYGPKADFMAKDVLGREWQLSTIQVDFIQPARLGCEYIGEDGKAHTPVLLHRAVTGSTERFMARPDRALRRRLPRLALPRAGRSHPRSRQAPGLRPRGSGAARREGPAGRGGRLAEQHAEEDQGELAPEDPLPAHSRGQGGRAGQRQRAQARGEATGGDGAGCFRRERPRGGSLAHLKRLALSS